MSVKAGEVHSVLGVAVITALFFMAFFIFMMVMPASMWSMHWGSHSQVRSLWKNKNGISTPKGVFLWFLTPIIINWSIFLTGFFLENYHITYHIGLALLYLTCSCFYFKRISDLLGSNKLKYKEFFSFLFFSTASSFFIIMPLNILLMFYFNEGGDSLHSKKLLILFFCFLFVLLGNWLIATLDYRQNTMKSTITMIFIGSIVFYLVLAMFNDLALISRGVMKLYKFGNIENASLVLNDDGCKIVDGIKIYSREEGSTCVIDHIKILSRMGKNMYLETKTSVGEIRFTMPSDFVLSWATTK